MLGIATIDVAKEMLLHVSPDGSRYRAKNLFDSKIQNLKRL